MRFIEDGEVAGYLTPDTLVSMNLWGLTRSFIDEAERRFPAFLDKALAENPMKGEFLLPTFVGDLVDIGKISLKVDEHALKSFREFGLMLFLVGAGVEGGVELVEQIANSTYGIMIVVYGFVAGMIMTLIPMIIGFLFAKKICKLPLLNNLGSITGGMTSTPALGTLINVAGTEDVAAAYAATYPIALIAVVLVSQFLIILF